MCATRSVIALALALAIVPTAFADTVTYTVTTTPGRHMAPRPVAGDRAPSPSAMARCHGRLVQDTASPLCRKTPDGGLQCPNKCA